MLIRTRTPLRLGLAGGGTDVSPFCDTHGGYVLNATIDLYAYTSLEILDEKVIKFIALDTNEEYSGPAEIDYEYNGPLSLHYGVYKRVVKQYCDNRPFGVKIITRCDAPPGSGLGSSSTVITSILHAFGEALNIPLGEYDLAQLAYEIERIDLSLAGGKQDQYSAAFGGVNFMEFNANDHVLVNPLRIKPWIKSELESSLLLFFSGVSRDSAEIIKQQASCIENRNSNSIDALLKVKNEALKMKEALLKGDFKAFVESMRRGWKAKKNSASCVSNNNIDYIYETAINAGAQAGKVSGAGGGGFMYFFVDPMVKLKVIEVLMNLKGRIYNCNLTEKGSEAWRINGNKCTCTL